MILSHGFPYDAHAYDEVAPILVQKGARVTLPYTRGFGGTRFIDKGALRNVQQATRGADIIQLNISIFLRDCR